MDGTESEIGTVAISPIDKTVTLRCYGGMISVLLDSVVQIGPIDDTSAPLSAGRCGIIDTNGAATTYELDDFSATVYSPVTGRTTKNSRQWGMNLSPGTRLQYMVGGR